MFDTIRGEIGVDLETCSATDLPRAGAWRYSLCPSTRVWVLSWCYALDGIPSVVHRWHPWMEPPADLCAFVRAGGRLLAHNATFERALWANVLVPRFGFPPMALDQWTDTQPLAAAIGLPVTLEGMCAALRTAAQKDTGGADVMRKLATVKVVDGEYVYPSPPPEELERLYAYCDVDVLSMMQARQMLPALSVFEHRVWSLDQRINTRGVCLDERFAAKLRKLGDERTARLANSVRDDAFFEIHNATSAPMLKNWLRLRGVEIPTTPRRKKDGSWHRTESTDKAALQTMLERPELPDDVREVLETRLEATKTTSLAKLARVPAMVDQAGRLRDALAYCAAHTGRWASYGLQLHNLHKNSLEPDEAALVLACIEREDLDALELVVKRPLDVLSQNLRGVLVAAPGHELIGADYSAIEACVCSWLAGQDDKVAFLHEFFREKARWRRGERTTKPTDLYEFAAAGIGSDSRQLGKVAELALQYGMGDRKFMSTANKAGVALDLVTAASTKRAWRRSNTMIVRFWAELQAAAIAAVQEPGTTITLGRLVLRSLRTCLFITLPSGRALRYWAPRVDHREKEVEYVNDAGELVKTKIKGPELSYLVPGDDKVTLERETTYGGKLVENVTQAVARDVLAQGLLDVDTAGYPIVVHVHDAIAAEVPAGTGDVGEFCALMTKLPAWAEGLPIAAEGYRGRRFKG